MIVTAIQPFGKYIILIGAIIMVVGIIVYFAGDRLGWFGNLPGDIKVVKPGFKFYAPIISMLLVSVLLSLVMYIIRRFF